MADSRQHLLEKWFINEGKSESLVKALRGMPASRT
jgi:hypothetical protein